MTLSPEQLAEALELAQDFLEILNERKALRARVAELEQMVDCHDDASTSAFDEIAKLCGCEHWEYPGQVVRDVQSVVALRDRAVEELARLRPAADERDALALARELLLRSSRADARTLIALFDRLLEAKP